MSGKANPRPSTSSATNAPNTRDFKGVEVITDMLRSYGITEYDPQCIPMLLEFAHNYVTTVLTEAKAYSQHADKEEIDVEDAKMAVSMVLDKQMTTPLPRDQLLDIAEVKKSCPLPTVDIDTTVRPPPPKYPSDIFDRNAEPVIITKRRPIVVSTTPATTTTPTGAIRRPIQRGRGGVIATDGKWRKYPLRFSKPRQEFSMESDLPFYEYDNNSLQIYTGNDLGRDEIMILRQRAMARAGKPSPAEQPGKSQVVRLMPSTVATFRPDPAPPSLMTLSRPFPSTSGTFIKPAPRIVKRKPIANIQAGPVASSSGPVVITIPSGKPAPTATVTGPIVLPIQAGQPVGQVSASFATPIAPISFARPGVSVQSRPLVITIPATPQQPTATVTRQVRFPVARPKPGPSRGLQPKQPPGNKRKHLGD